MREFRNELIKSRVRSVAARRKKANQRILRKKNEFAKSPKLEVSEPLSQAEKKSVAHEKLRSKARKVRKRKRKSPPHYNPKQMPASRPSPLKILGFDEYKPSGLVHVVHVIDSSGMGGAQTMMMELVNGLNKYYEGFIKNHVIVIGKERKDIKNSLFTSYGIEAKGMPSNKLISYCRENEIGVVLHHRTARARSLRQDLPEKVKYILLNHTWNNMNAMSRFHECDYFVSVCKFLHKKTKWESFIDDSRKLVILNGVENDYIGDLPKQELSGFLKTGRCHRLVSGKFRIDSLTWLSRKALKIIPGLTHFLIGSHAGAKKACKLSKNLTYFGPISERQKKMSIIKELDLYFYETFSHEGASIAILESLACGVPVLCNPKGGNTELVTHGKNGFVITDRQEALLFMQQMVSDNLKNAMKKRARDDFDKRLHVRHVACKYMQLFEQVEKE